MKTNILYVIMAILVFVIFLQRCGGGPKYIKDKLIIDTVITYDTIRIHDTIISKPKLIYQKKDTAWLHDTLYAPSGDYNTLLSQYNVLGNKFFSKNIYSTPLSLGKYGNATIVDTVTSNQLIGSSFTYNLNIPKEQIVIHEPIPLNRQVYVGGGLFGSKESGVTGGFVSGLYKDRRDRIFGVNIGYNPKGFTYGFSSYWKIKLR